MDKLLPCQECGAEGKYIEFSEDGYNLYYECSWCNGTGKITPKVRSDWLNYKRMLKRESVSILVSHSSINDMYRNLLLNQEPLGKEFDKILHDNFWDLLVKDDE